MENELLHKSITDKIGEALITSKQTIAVAESVTAGHLQACLSLADKALEFFQGGITAYNIGQKTKHLGVNPIHALATNCVSEKLPVKWQRTLPLLSIVIGELESQDMHHPCLKKILRNYLPVLPLPGISKLSYQKQ